MTTSDANLNNQYGSYDGSGYGYSDSDTSTSSFYSNATLQKPSQNLFKESPKMRFARSTLVILGGMLAGWASYAAVTTAPLWKPLLVSALLAAGPIGWGILGGAALVTLVALSFILKEKDEHVVDALQRWTLGRLQALISIFPLILNGLLILPTMAAKDGIVEGADKGQETLREAGVCLRGSWYRLADALAAPPHRKYALQYNGETYFTLPFYVFSQQIRGHRFGNDL